MLQTGYIVSPRGDAFWFLGLPFLALAFALASQQWLSAVVIASIVLWIDIPHNFSTFLRIGGLAEDRERFKDRLIVGGVVIAAMIFVGLRWAPLTLVLLTTMWRHQHNMMQLHGFARIYDFKARTGAPTTGRWDLWMGWMLYLNLFLTAPLFTTFWVRELHRFRLPIDAFGVRVVHAVSWATLAVFACFYAWHVISCLRAGYKLNPIKYAFLVANYSVLYFVSWHTASVLVYAVANLPMHGLQYLVINYLYIQRKVEQQPKKSWVEHLVRPGNVAAFATVLILYAMVYQWMLGRPLDEFGFGFVNFSSMYDAVPDYELGSMTAKTGQELWLLVLIQLPGILHLYYDSFIWKVRDKVSQKGL